MDLTQLRAHTGPGPSDDVLEDLLAAALEAIDGRYGPTIEGYEEHREYLRPFGQWVRLGRRASSVVSVLEGGAEVVEPDYALWPGGWFLRRLSGDDPTAWSGWVDVTYTPLSESAERDRITVALVKLDISHNPGLASVTVGPWSESYTGQAPEEYAATRDAILGSLRPPRVGVW